MENRKPTNGPFAMPVQVTPADEIFYIYPSLHLCSSRFCDNCHFNIMPTSCHATWQSEARARGGRQNVTSHLPRQLPSIYFPSVSRSLINDWAQNIQLRRQCFPTCPISSHFFIFIYIIIHSATAVLRCTCKTHQCFRSVLVCTQRREASWRLRAGQESCFLFLATQGLCLSACAENGGHFPAEEATGSYCGQSVWAEKKKKKRW